MELLDFGYSQSKWVAEQVVFDARNRGLSARIFRPALVSPSVTGGGNNFDIAVRLVAFMVNHGIGVDTLNQVSFVPADIVANNIVAISTTPGTANKTYHVVRDDYSNMMDITGLITKATGRQFEIIQPARFRSRARSGDAGRKIFSFRCWIFWWAPSTTSPRWSSSAMTTLPIKRHGMPLCGAKRTRPWKTRSTAF